jgi:hypothetical protein
MSHYFRWPIPIILAFVGIFGALLLFMPTPPPPPLPQDMADPAVRRAYQMLADIEAVPVGADYRELIWQQKQELDRNPRLKQVLVQLLEARAKSPTPLPEPTP